MVVWGLYFWVVNMEKMKEAQLIIRFKNQRAYLYTAYVLGRQYLNYASDKDKDKAIQRSQAVKDIINYLRVFDKQVGEAIREGRVRIFFERDGDNTISFDMKGTKEEIDKWTKISTAQKIALKTYLKPIMSVEVKK